MYGIRYIYLAPSCPTSPMKQTTAAHPISHWPCLQPGNRCSEDKYRRIQHQSAISRYTRCPIHRSVNQLLISSNLISSSSRNLSRRGNTTYVSQAYSLLCHCCEFFVLVVVVRFEVDVCGVGSRAARSQTNCRPQFIFFLIRKSVTRLERLQGWGFEFSFFRVDWT